MQRVADALGLRLSGTLSAAASVSSTSVADSGSRHEANDHPNEGFLLTTSSAVTQQEARVSDFDNGTQTISLYGALTTSLSSGAAYDLYLPPVTPAMYRSAVRAAASKLAGRGMGRRVLDTSLVTTASRRYALPSALDANLAEVYLQALELIPNNTWLNDDSGWTLHANASLTNEGASSERTLALVASSSAQYSYVDLDVSPLTKFEFFARTKGAADPSAIWYYRISDPDGTVLAGYSVLTSTLAATWTETSATVEIPSNGARLRLAFATTAAGTVYTQAPQLMRYGDWERVAGWAREYDGETGYLLLPGQPPSGRRLKLVGQRSLEVPTTDFDTISLDEPEVAAFVELCCSEVWRQFGGLLSGSRTAVDTEVSKHEAAYRELVGRLSSEWRQARRVRYPRLDTAY